MDEAPLQVLGGCVEATVRLQLGGIVALVIWLTVRTVNRDDFISRWRNTNYPREEILRRIIG